ncbi:glycoside hydrolase family 5 protein [Pseudaminobacter soli (ex Li et al. 2025)]|nr:cellulase family glycosylhydrolase [Mesorhizobium soli]
MMNWGALQDGDPGRYLPRPFETPRNAYPAALMRDFARSGFDFIRLTLDVGPFMQLQGADREALEQKLIGNIRLFHDLGLAVIVDCHPVEQVPAYSAPSILDDLEGPLFADYTAMIGRLATLLAGVQSGYVALELMNEPVIREASHRTQVKVWGAAQLVLHDAARRAAADLPLLLTGASYGGISGLRDLDPSPFTDSNTLFSFHYYMPISFTHQGIDFGTVDAPASPYVVDLPYPYDAVPAKEIEAAIEARIAADTALDPIGRVATRNHTQNILEGFLSDAWNRERIVSDFAEVEAWADRSGVARHRIIVGECGVTRRAAGFTGADDLYRKRWLSDVTHLAQAAGFGWALWEINSREMGINRVDDRDRVDPDIVAALAMSD